MHTLPFHAQYRHKRQPAHRDRLHKYLVQRIVVQIQQRTHWNQIHKRRRIRRQHPTNINPRDQLNLIRVQQAVLQQYITY